MKKMACLLVFAGMLAMAACSTTSTKPESMGDDQAKDCSTGMCQGKDTQAKTPQTGQKAMIQGGITSTVNEEGVDTDVDFDVDVDTMIDE